MTPEQSQELVADIDAEVRRLLAVVRGLRRVRPRRATRGGTCPSRARRTRKRDRVMEVGG